VLLPWLPTLITTLRADGAELAPLLIREAGRIFPARLPELDAWVPPWRLPQDRPGVRAQALGEQAGGVPLLAAHPAACDALADLLGCDGEWETAGPASSGAVLLGRHPATAVALETLLAVS
jgi:hypothetical protein